MGFCFVLFFNILLLEVINANLKAPEKALEESLGAADLGGRKISFYLPNWPPLSILTSLSQVHHLKVP